eukprot:317282_1
MCPINSDNHTCSVYCDSTYSCRGLDIYAINGYSQLAFNCNGNNAYCSGIRIFCTPYFNETCTVSNEDCYGFCNSYQYTDNQTQVVDISFGSNNYYYSASNIT